MMETIKRDLSTNFTHGTISGTLTLAGDGVESRPEMLDNVFRQVSKAVYRGLIPHFNESKEVAELPQGETIIEEQLKLELLGLTFTYDIKIVFDVEFKSPAKEGIRFLVMEVLGPDVVYDAVGRIATRLKAEVIKKYYEEHPDDIPFGPSFFADDRAGAGLGPIGRIFADSSAGGGPTLH